MLYILFAAYNEEQIMPAFMDNIKAEIEKLNVDYAVIPCTDASTDNTAKVIAGYKSSMPIILLEQTQERGLGVAFRRALEAVCDVSKSDDDIALFMDADCTHDLKYASPMIEKIRAGNDVVIASRFLPASTTSGFPFHRTLLSYGASIFFRILFPIKGVKDYTSGYRAYKVSALKKAYQHYGDELIVEKNFCCLAELLIKLKKLECRFVEVPFSYDYGARGGGSKMQISTLITATFKMSWNLFKGK